MPLGSTSHAEQLTPLWFRGKRVVVMGLGLHGGGVGTTLWLLRHGAHVTVTDLRDQHLLAPSIAQVEKAFITAQRTHGRGMTHRVTYVLGEHREEDFVAADMVLQNPGVPRESPFLAVARQHGARIENDVSLFFQMCPLPILAVTGTRGKTTTTTLVGAIAKLHDRRSVIGGNIRIPVLGLLDALLTKKISVKKGRTVPIAVLELSSWQLEALEQHKMSPHIGVITNVFPDHLNRYRDMTDYAAAKSVNVVFQHADDVAVLNADNAWTQRIGEEADPRTGQPLLGQVWWFGRTIPAHSDGVFVQDATIVLRRSGKEEFVCAVTDLHLLGEHNLMNTLAAVAASAAANIPLPTIAAGVSTFRGVPDRQELIAEYRGVRWVNDTTATSPDAAIVALKTFGDRTRRNIILISGGADKKLEFADWAATVQQFTKHLVLFDGTATPRMEQVLESVGSTVPRIGARSMEEAVRLAAEAAEAGDVVLLSPGCASFGLFLHEFDRGQQFVRAVRKLTKQRALRGGGHRVGKPRK